jgi:predicted MFS family arabinose efflux permease
VIHPSSTSNTTQQASFFLTALWWGSLTTVGFMVVPMLFARMDSMQAAGKMAAALFNAQDYVGWVCGAVLALIYMRNKPLAQQNMAQAASYLIAITLLASLISHWLVAPQILTRDNLKLWHSLGTVLYLCQWVCVTALVYLRIRKASA